MTDMLLLLQVFYPSNVVGHIDVVTLLFLMCSFLRVYHYYFFSCRICHPDPCSMDSLPHVVGQTQVLSCIFQCIYCHY